MWERGHGGDSNCQGRLRAPDNGAKAELLHEVGTDGNWGLWSGRSRRVVESAKCEAARGSCEWVEGKGGS